MTTTNLTASTMQGVPDPILRSLRKMIRRVRTVIVVRGVCAVAAALVAALLAAMAVDASVILFADWMRWALSGAVLAATVAAALGFLVRPLVRTFTLAGIAQAVEARHPEMQERISSAVELLTSRDDPALRGSAALIGALATQAVSTAASIQPRREAPLRSARPFFIALAVVGAVLGGLLIGWPGSTTRLLVRAVAPYLNLPNVAAADLRISPDRDSVLAVGDRLRVEVVVANRKVRSAELRVSDAAGNVEAQPMSRLSKAEGAWPRFALTCPPAIESFRYRIQAGDALSRYYSVTVVQPPIVRDLSVAYDYPDYTGLTDWVDGEIDTGIRAPVRTIVDISVTASKPIAKAELLVNDQVVQTLEADEDTPVFTFRRILTTKLRGRWAIRLTDRHGFASLSDEYGIEAVRDGKPAVQVLRPASTVLRVKPTDRLPILYSARDDFGVAAVEMILETDGKPLPVVTLHRPDAAAPLSEEVPGTFELDLSTHPLEGVRQMTFQLRASDNLPANMGGPQKGVSELYTIRFDRDAPSFAEQVELAGELRIRSALQDVLAELKEAKKDSLPLREALARFLPAGQRKELTNEAKSRREKEQSAIAAELKAAETAAREATKAMRDTLTPEERREASARQREILKELREQRMRTWKSAAETRKWRAEPLDEKTLAALNVEVPQRTGRVGKRLAAAGEILRRAIEQTANGPYMPMSVKLSSLVDNHVARAENLVGQVPLTEEATERYDLADEADFQIDRAIEIVSDLLGEFDVMTDMVRKARKLQELADQQAALAAAKAMQEQKRDEEARQFGSEAEPMTPEEWIKAQEELAERIAEMLREDPGALREQMDRDEQKTKDLAEEARELAQQQLALAGDSKRLEEMQKVDKQLEDLAAEQQKLADRVAKNPAAAEQAPTMTSAAEKIRAEDLGEAVKDQAKAEAGLKSEARDLEREHATAELAKQARDLAKQQEAMAEQAASAQKQQEAAQARAEDATRQAGEAAKDAEQAKQELSGTLAELHKRQKDLAAEAKKLAEPSAKKETERLASRASESMEQAATEIAKQDVARATETARKATSQAQDLQRATEKDAHRAAEKGQEERQKRSAAARKAEQQAREAQGRADDAKRQAAEKAQTASAQAKSASEARKQAAEQSAKSASEAKQAHEANKAAEAAQKRADQASAEAARASQAAKSASPEQKAAADREAREAQGRAEDAKRQAGEKAKEASAQGKAASEAQKQAGEQAGKVAQAGKQAEAAAKASESAQKQAGAAEAAAKKASEAAQQAQAGQAAGKSGEETAAAERAQKGKQVAEAQKALADELGKLAGQDVAKAARAEQKAQQAAEQQARAGKAAAEAAKRGGEMAGRQEELGKKAEELTQRAKAGEPAAKQAAEQHDPTGAMQQAAKAMKDSQGAQAAKSAGEAATQAGELADVLTKAAESGTSSGEGQAGRGARELGEMAAKQEELRKKTSELAGEKQKLDSQQEARQASALGVQQEKLAREAARLSGRVKKEEPQSDRIETAAAREARRAASAMGKGKTDEAGEAAREAAEKLGELAERLGGESAQAGEQSGQQSGESSGEQSGQSSGKAGGGQPSQGEQVAVGGSTGEQAGPAEQAKTDLADAAADLAERQKDVAEQIQALAEGRDADLASAQQEGLAGKTQELADDTDLLRDHAEDVLEDAGISGMADSAAEALAQAARAQGEAGQQLAGQMPGAAAASQGKSAQALAAAAKSLDEMGRKLSAAMAAEKSRSRSDAGAESEQLSDALEAAGQAGQGQSAAAARAAQLLQQLAQRAAQQAQGQGLSPFSDPWAMLNQEMFGGGGGGVGMTYTDLTAAKLESLGITMEDWSRLPGELRDEILQAAAETGPREYLPLIRRYFRELARRGQQKAAAKTKEQE